MSHERHFLKKIGAFMWSNQKIWWFLSICGDKVWLGDAEKVEINHSFPIETLLAVYGTLNLALLEILLFYCVDDRAMMMVTILPKL